jgi:hypothetical protein
MENKEKTSIEFLGDHNLACYDNKAVTRVSFLETAKIPSRSRTEPWYGVHEAPAIFEIARVFLLRK